MRRRVLFLCTANSARSQMAEAWARALHGEAIEAHSAGTRPTAVHPLAVAVMREAGIDISGQRAKSLEEFLGQPFDAVITLCGDAQEACPAFPGAARTIHRGFPDPAAAAAKGTPEEALAAFRRVRDELRAWIEGLPQILDGAS
ncbi:MAG: arsenate reductase ArsC [Firmicutes bacterium]|nr:arsenate reductase ArsC [Bacillota bacterium]